MLAGADGGAGATALPASYILHGEHGHARRPCASAIPRDSGSRGCLMPASFENILFSPRAARFLQFRRWTDLSLVLLLRIHSAIHVSECVCVCGFNSRIGQVFAVIKFISEQFCRRDY